MSDPLTPPPVPAGEDGFGANPVIPDPLRAPQYFDGVLWKRVFGYLIDLMVIVLVLALLYIPAAFIGLLSFGALWPALTLGLALVPLLYHTLLIGGPRSATLGMRLFGVEVLVRNGARPDFVRAAALTLLFYLSIMLTTWLILVIALFNREKRTLHDFVCNTMVVNSFPDDEGRP